ncbi:MAG: hypothetical protein NW237_05505 [Cyanobacteriota bacterium]|nr:hypothetical protein [Cyanobacteriota bacterium]
MVAVACTLYEGHYHYGVGALANSLYTHGYRGNFWVGYRGELPFWATNVAAMESYSKFSVKPDFSICFVPLETTIHFTNYKPNFMLQVWEQFDPSIESLIYIDPDITIKCRWSFFDEWVKRGIALCQDVNITLNADHPFRYIWKDYAEKLGFGIVRSHDYYFNGGFVGIYGEYKSFLNLWSDLIGNLSQLNIKIDLSKFMQGDGSHPFVSADQNTLNLMSMLTPFPLSTIGSEGMDFSRYGFTMSHAIGSPKPWIKNYLWSALDGYPPTRADQNFWNYTQSPIKLYSSIFSAWKKRELSMAKAFARFYGRR